jgi:hypothetical protein
MVAIGYIIETCLVQSGCLGLGVAVCIQMFYVWRLPHNEGKVRTLQKVTMSANLICFLLGAVTGIDHRSVYGIYSYFTPFALGVTMSIPITTTSLIWHKVTLNVVLAGSIGHPKVHRISSFFQIKNIHVLILSLLHIVLSINLLVITKRTDFMMLWSLVLGYFALLATFSTIVFSLMCFLMWKHYQYCKESETARMGAQLLADQIDEGAAQNFNLKLSKSIGDLNAVGGDHQIAPAQAFKVSKDFGNEEAESEKLWSVVKKTGRAALVAFSVGIILIIATWQLADDNLRISQVMFADPANYRFNFKLSIMIGLFVMVVILGHMNSRLDWRPPTSKMKNVRNLSRVE